MNFRQRVLVIIGILISIFFLWIAFNGLHPADVWSHIQQANVLLLLMSIVVFFVSTFIIARRWGYLLGGIATMPTRYLFELVCMCYMGNNVYPMRAGEFLRILLLQRDYRVPVVRSTTTIFIERVFDGLIMLSFIVVPLFFIESAPVQLKRIASVATPVFVVGSIVFFGLAARPDWLRKLIELLVRILPGKIGSFIKNIGEDVIGGLDGLRGRDYLMGAIFNSVSTWVVHAGVYWIVGAAMGIQVSYWVMLIAVGAVNLAGVIPASPGQVGVFEFFASEVVIRIGGVDESQAKAFALVLHVIIWLPVTLYGFYLLAHRGLNWQTITHAREMESSAASSG
jgi:glycosyltransferase 2 family protein